MVTPDTILALLAALGAITTIIAGKKSPAPSSSQTPDPSIVTMLQEAITAMESSNKNLREENENLKADNFELTRENDQLKAELRRAYTRLDRLEGGS